jgi:hypothetical protein
VTLQVSLAPPDIRHATELLPHQLRTWGGQVDEVLLTVDTRRSRGRRFGAEWHGNEALMADFLASLQGEHDNLRVEPVDYERALVGDVAARFFGRKTIPAKDFRGGPFYSYFFALHMARYDHVLHVDSDMLFGGGSQGWVDDALGMLEARPEVLTVGPLPGPPTDDGNLRAEHWRDAVREADHTFSFPNFTTRVFLVDRTRLSGIPLRRMKGWRGRLRGELQGQPSYELPEILIAELMAERGWRRLDFLGPALGMWSLHPVEHTDEFRQALPTLISRVEAGDVSAAQVGHYNLHESMLPPAGVVR